MTYMIIEFTFEDDAYAEIECGNIKFWAGYGLPTFEGGLKEFDQLFPEYMNRLVFHKVVKITT